MANPKKNIPVLRFPEFEEEWESKKLKDISTVTSGGTPSRANESYWGGDIPWITTSEIKGGNRIVSSSEKITVKGLKNSSAKIFPENTILIAMYGQGHTRGRTAILKFPAATNQACAAITLNKYFHSDFILQDLIRRYDELRNLANDGGQKNLSGSLIKSLNVSYPKSIEQQKIADSLTSVDDKIGQLERKKAALEAYKKGMMQQLFSQQTRFKNDQDEGFPEWEVKKLGELGETYGGLTGKTKDDFGEGKPYIQYTQLYASSVISIDNCGLVEISPSERQNQVNSGDLFFTTSSETPNEIALSCVLLEEPKEVYLNSFCFGYRLKKPNKSFSKFLSYLLKTSTMRRKIIPLAQGSTRYNISKKELMKISIQVPHPSEQQKIADFLTALDCKIDLIAQELSQAQSFKKGLLQKMFV